MIVVDGKCLEGVGVEPDIVVPLDVRLAVGWIAIKRIDGETN